MTVMNSILIGVAVAFFATAIDALLREGHYNLVSWRSLGFVAAGAVVGLMSGFTATATKGWLVLFLIVFAVFYAALTAWSIRECGRWRELALFLLLGALLWFPTMAVAELLGPVVRSVSQIVISTLSGVWIVNLLFFKSKVSEKKLYQVLAWILIALLAISDVAQVVALVKNQPERAVATAEPAEPAEPKSEPEQQKPEPASEPELEPVEPEWYSFYNTVLLEDEDPKNDFNFGQNPLPEILQEKLARGEISLKDLTTKKLGPAYDLLPEEELNALVLKQIETGELQLEDILDKPQDELYKLITAEELKDVFFERLAEDPAYGAGNLAWIDFNLGTRYLGKFHSEVDDQWDKAINDAKVAWMEDCENYLQTIAAFTEYASHAKDIKITKVTRGLDDQMYQNPFTVDGVPDVIVMESLDMGGYFLTFVFNPKGSANDIEVSFRADCGFQPTNVSAMGIPVQKNPNKSGGGQRSDNGGGQRSDNGGGQVTETGGGKPLEYEITHPKDSSIPPVEGKNEEQGPGRDTRNGVGATMSSAEVETSTRSTGMSDEKREYWDEENEYINQTQRVGGDSNNPSDRSETVNGITDNNGATGNRETGSASIDQGTSVKDPTTINSGRQQGNTGDNAYGSFTPPENVTETKPDTHAPTVFDGDFGANE